MMLQFRAASKVTASFRAIKIDLAVPTGGCIDTARLNL